MKRIRIVDPQGHTWSIAVRWLPWSLRWRGKKRSNRPSSGRPGRDTSRWLDLIDLGDAVSWIDESFGTFALILFAAGLLLALIFFVVPVFIFVVELLIVLLVVVGGLLLRVLFRRPWFVDAMSERAGGKVERVWAVVGYRRASEAVDEIGRQIELGHEVPVLGDARLVRDSTNIGGRS